MNTCGKVVYHLPGNDLTSSYCGLQAGHKGECKFVPEEAVVQICKQLLIERGEVVELRYGPGTALAHAQAHRQDGLGGKCLEPCGYCFDARKRGEVTEVRK